MKKSIFRDILNEEYIEVNKSVSKTIQCLREQSGRCRDSVPNNINDKIQVYFECSKDGRICIENMFRGIKRDRYRMYYVYGNIVSKDNKTYIKTISFYKKSDIWVHGFLLVLLFVAFLLLLTLEITLMLKTSVHEVYILAAVVSFIIFLIVTIYPIKAIFIRKKHGIELIELMEKELKKRVQNIERWED